MPVVGNFISGQILYASNLNATFLKSAAVGGDLFTGTVTVPNLTITSGMYSGTIISNTAISVAGLDVKSSILQASGTSNSAYSQANTAFNLASNNSSLTQSAFNQANAALAASGSGMSTTGATMSGALTINNTLNASNTITSNAEIHGTANSTSFGGQFRAIQGNFGTILRNDGTNFYIETTGNVPLGSVGTAFANGLIPFQFNLTTGVVTLDATGVGTKFGGNVTTTSVNATYVNSVALNITTVNIGGTYILSQKDSGTVIYYNNTQPLFVNVNSSLYVGFRAVVTQVNSGTVTFRAGPGVVLNSRVGTLNQIASIWSSASVVGYAPNTFLLDGNIQ